MNYSLSQKLLITSFGDIPTLSDAYQNKMPSFYKRYVDDTLSIMPDVEAASTFLSTLNEIHPSISFTMELEKTGNFLS